MTRMIRVADVLGAAYDLGGDGLYGEIGHVLTDSRERHRRGPKAKPLSQEEEEAADTREAVPPTPKPKRLSVGGVRRA